MPVLRGGRPLKSWRYVGVYGPELMLCAADIDIGPLRQQFWAIWTGQLHERTRSIRRPVDLRDGRLRVADGDVLVDLELTGGTAVETIGPHGAQYAWTQKTAGGRARGLVTVAGVTREVDAPAVIDDSAGYHARITRWRWSAGAGRSTDGQAIAWNLVEGINDWSAGSERTIWLDGEPQDEVAPVSFDGLDGVSFAGGEELRSSAVATRRRSQELLVVASEYEQPFGSFTGTLPGGIELAEGYGVMERHRARW